MTPRRTEWRGEPPVPKSPSAERVVLLLAHDLAAALAVDDHRRAVGAAVALSDVAAELVLQLEPTVPEELDLDLEAGIARIRCLLP